MTVSNSATADADLIGKPLLAIVLIIIYGIYRVVQEGIFPAGWPNGTILVVCGVLSALAVLAYARSIERGSSPSVGKALAGFSGLIPYAYSLYVMGYVGVWSLVQLLMVEFSVTGLLVGLFGILVGYRILKTFYDITQVGQTVLGPRADAR